MSVDRVWRWREGRQEQAKYEVLTLWRFRLGWDRGIDAHVIRYRDHVELPSHVDPVADGRRHFRLNLIVGEVGKFWADRIVFNLRGRVILFRADAPHGMRLSCGRRWVLSFGAAL